jgi:catechol 2,3-dioxygenase-like lactoylglutathione lyase family enzyme
MRPTLTHLALHVQDIAACIAFYEDYCRMRVVHERGQARQGNRTVWLAEPGKEQTFVIVLISGGPRRSQAENDFSHAGFALSSREEVDAVAARAQAEGVLAWPPRQEAYPVGYYCGLRTPHGAVVEFSFGQPLGPGAPEQEPQQ